MLLDKEHYDLMERFERQYRGLRLDREDKSFWPRQRIYQNGEANALFLAYRQGYALAKALFATPAPGASHG